MSGPDEPAQAAAPGVGDELTLDIGAVAHGGHCVARFDGRVVFVRHALPGERAVVRLTDTSHDGYFRGDAVQILRADPRRVTPRCGHFGPAGCGGCDFQHADATLQRELKGAVVAEQLSRLAGIERSVVVEPIGTEFGWRTRVRWALDSDGRIGPRATRSHEVVGISALHPCEIAADGLSAAVDALDIPPGIRGGATSGSRRGKDRRGRDRRAKLPEVTLLRPAGSEVLAVWQGAQAPEITESVAGRDFGLAADGFWQVHPAAAQALSDAVAQALEGLSGSSLAGGSAWDLYGGVGLFAAVLADRVGVGGSVLTVESDAAATDHARANLADLPQVRAVTGRVEQVLGELADRVDAVVLDPPRSGAGKAVCTAIAAREPAGIVYVACDPAALARDTATLGGLGYRLDTLRAFDLFPQTHHVECVARFVPVGAGATAGRRG